MNTQTDATVTNPMQMTEAFPLEDRSLPADEVINAQQSEVVEGICTPIFIP
jgi:hypothetical protein